MNSGSATAKALSNATREVQQASKEIQSTSPYPGSDQFTLLIFLKNLEVMLRDAERVCETTEV